MDLICLFKVFCGHTNLNIKWVGKHSVIIGKVDFVNICNWFISETIILIPGTCYLIVQWMMPLEMDMWFFFYGISVWHWSLAAPSSRVILFYILSTRQSICHKSMDTPSYILNGTFSNNYQIAFYHMKNRISLQQFEWTIFERVNFPFLHRIFHYYLCAWLLHFKWKFLKTLYACLFKKKCISLQ